LNPPNKIPGYATGLGDEECGTRETKSVNITGRQNAKNKTQKYEKKKIPTWPPG